MVEGDGEVIIYGKGIYKTYRVWFPVPRQIKVLKGANIEIRKDEMTGIIGENGSGKSTLMKILVGELGKDSGDFGRCFGLLEES